MKYVVWDRDGRRLDGVRKTSPRTANYWKQHGFRFERVTANNHLSLAASAVWRIRTQQPPFIGDYNVIEYWQERKLILDAIASHGYETPGQYNDDLRDRMCDGKTLDGRWKMSLRVREMLEILEAEDVCPRCGSALEVKTTYTKNYGGGQSTFEKCTSCNYSEVYV